MTSCSQLTCFGTPGCSCRGGRPVRDKTGNCICKCFLGYHGDSCQKRKSCTHLRCKYGRIRLEDCQCICIPLFSGPSCTKPLKCPSWEFSNCHSDKKYSNCSKESVKESCPYKCNVCKKQDAMSCEKDPNCHTSQYGCTYIGKQPTPAMCRTLGDNGADIPQICFGTTLDKDTNCKRCHDGEKYFALAYCPVMCGLCSEQRNHTTTRRPTTISMTTSPPTTAASSSSSLNRAGVNPTSTRSRTAVTSRVTSGTRPSVTAVSPSRTLNTTAAGGFLTNPTSAILVRTTNIGSRVTRTDAILTMSTRKQPSTGTSAAIKGGVTGAVIGAVLLAAVIFAVCLVWRRKKRENQAAKSCVHFTATNNPPQLSEHYYNVSDMSSPIKTVTNNENYQYTQVYDALKPDSMDNGIKMRYPAYDTVPDEAVGYGVQSVLGEYPLGSWKQEDNYGYVEDEVESRRKRFEGGLFGDKSVNMAESRDGKGGQSEKEGTYGVEQDENMENDIIEKGSRAPYSYVPMVNMGKFGNKKPLTSNQELMTGLQRGGDYTEVMEQSGYSYTKVSPKCLGQNSDDHGISQDYRDVAVRDDVMSRSDVVDVNVYDAMYDVVDNDGVSEVSPQDVAAEDNAYDVPNEIGQNTYSVAYDESNKGDKSNSLAKRENFAAESAYDRAWNNDAQDHGGVYDHKGGQFYDLSTSVNDRPFVKGDNYESMYSDEFGDSGVHEYGRLDRQINTYDSVGLVNDSDRGEDYAPLNKVEGRGEYDVIEQRK